MTIREIVAARAAATQGPAVPESNAVTVSPLVLTAVQQAPDRALGSREPQGEVIPMEWPHDPGAADGNQLCVLTDAENRGWLGVALPDGRFIFLLGPMRSITLPF